MSVWTWTIVDETVGLTQKIVLTSKGMKLTMTLMQSEKLINLIGGRVFSVFNALDLSVSIVYYDLQW